MISRDAQPKDHKPVYRRIEFGPVRRPPEAAEPVDLLTEAKRRTRAEQIWQITRQTAEGCNSVVPSDPVAVRSEYIAPCEDCA